MAWLTVARKGDVPQDGGHRILVNGRELAIFQVGSEFYCIDNSCPHMDGPLSEGELDGEIVHCPWHFWPISVTTGKMTYDSAVCVQTFPCKADGEEIMIEIEI